MHRTLRAIAAALAACLGRTAGLLALAAGGSVGDTAGQHVAARSQNANQHHCGQSFKRYQFHCWLPFQGGFAYDLPFFRTNDYRLASDLRQRRRVSGLRLRPVALKAERALT